MDRSLATAQLAAEGEAVHPGHDDIGDQQFRSACFIKVAGFVAVFRFDDL